MISVCLSGLPPVTQSCVCVWVTGDSELPVGLDVRLCGYLPLSTPVRDWQPAQGEMMYPSFCSVTAGVDCSPSETVSWINI